MNKEGFKNVIIFSLAEPGAGLGGYMEFVNDDGNYYTINYLSEEIYEKWFDIAMSLYCCKNE